jgi:hypothetical protein
MRVNDPEIANKISQFKHLKRFAFDSDQTALKDHLHLAGCEIIELPRYVGGNSKWASRLEAIANKKTGGRQLLKNYDAVSHFFTEGDKSKFHIPVADSSSDAVSSGEHFAVAPGLSVHETVEWFNFFRENPDANNLW